MPIEPVLAGKVRDLTGSLQHSLGSVVVSLSGSLPRPTSLARRLGLDKTLANRVVRAIRADDEMEFMSLVPAPAGLRIFIKAVRAASGDSGLLDELTGHVERFQSLIDEFPAGRSGLDAAISDGSPQIRDRNERLAKQSAFKAMSYLLGYQCEAVASAVAFQPSSESDQVDSLHLTAVMGLRRLRRGLPIVITGQRTYPADPASARDARIESLAGGHDVSDFLLERFCSSPLPGLTLVEDEGSNIVVLRENQPPTNIPVTIVCAHAMRDGSRKYRTADRDTEWDFTYHRYPCRIRIKDLLLREDVYEGVTPEISIRMPTVKDPTIHHTGILGQLDALDLRTNVEFRGQGRRAIGADAVPRYGEMIEHVFEEAGWDLERFRVYRSLTVYLLPLTSITWWIPLPDPPGDDADRGPA